MGARKKKLKFRVGIPREKGLFKKLWSEYLKEAESSGGYIAPDENNLTKFTELYDSIVNKGLSGNVIFHGEDSVALMSDLGVPFNTNLGKTLSIWGVYVKPEARKKGVGKALESEIMKYAKDNKYENIVTALPVGAKQSVDFAANRGFKFISYLALKEVK